MKNKLAPILVTALVASSILTGCGGQDSSSATEDTEATVTEAAEETPDETEGAEETKEAEAEEDTEDTADAEDTADVPMETVQLDVGEMQVYDFGDYKLHAYKTNDDITDVTYILETESNLIGIDSPCFYDNLEEYLDYIEELGKPLDDLLLPYHPAGGESFQVENVYGIQHTVDLLQEGGDNLTMIEGFREAFGDAFDGTVHEINQVIEPGEVNIGGVDFVISESADGFDIEIPAINCMLIHMMGSDVHNMLGSTEQIDEMIGQLQGFKEKGYTLILTTHYLPEGLDAVDTKIDYLEKTKELATSCTTKEEFIDAMNEAFPDYEGESFMESSAEAFFPEGE